DDIAAFQSKISDAIALMRCLVRPVGECRAYWPTNQERDGYGCKHFIGHLILLRRRCAARYYYLRKVRISSKKVKRGFSNSTKWVAFGMSTAFFDGACTRSRIKPSRSSENDQVSKAPAITRVGA